LDKERTS
jgi:hypothetical protein